MSDDPEDPSFREALDAIDEATSDNKISDTFDRENIPLRKDFTDRTDERIINLIEGNEQEIVEAFADIFLKGSIKEIVVASVTDDLVIKAIPEDYSDGIAANARTLLELENKLDMALGISSGEVTAFVEGKGENPCIAYLTEPLEGDYL